MDLQLAALPDAPARPADLAGVEVFYTVCPSASGSNLAINRGAVAAAFAGTGATPTSIRTHPDRAVREAHYTGDHRHLFREGGNVPALWARASGQDTRLLGLAWLEHHSTIAALPASGIESPEDLRGRRLGLVRRPNDPVDYPRASALKAYLDVLAHAGVGRDEVTFVDIVLDRPLVAAPPDPAALSASAFSARALRSHQAPLVTALLRGEVDAVHLGLAAVDLHALLGTHVVFDLAELDEAGRVDGPTPIAFTVRNDLLEARPDAVALYVAQSVAAARHARSHRDEARRWIARDLGIAEELVDQAYTPALYDSLEPTLDPHLVDLLTVQKGFLLAEGFIPDDVDIASWIAPGPLADARALLAG